MGFRIACIVCALAVFTVSAADAEIVFKKNGELFRCTIVKDEESNLTVKRESGAVEKIPRREILRVQYQDLSLEKISVRLVSGEVIGGYQVDEDKDTMTIRKVLIGTEEIVIPKQKILFIAKNNPTGLKVESVSDNTVLLAWNHPFEPAKKGYRVYIRELKARDAAFKKAGITQSNKFTVINLRMSRSYEFYVTAVGADGTESIPSERVIGRTMPMVPNSVHIEKELVKGRKSVRASLSWEKAPAESSVRSYAVYDIGGKEQKLVTTVKGTTCELGEYPWNETHRFVVRGVDEDGVESKDSSSCNTGIYPRFVIGARGAYIQPVGSLFDMTSLGYGAEMSASVLWPKISFGVSSGWYGFAPKEKGLHSLTMLPVTADLGFTVPLTETVSFDPVLRAGAVYSRVSYSTYRSSDTLSGSGWDPMAGAGAVLRWQMSDLACINAGAEYRAVIEKKNIFSFLAFSFGAEVRF